MAAACLGVAEVFFDNASQAMVPSLVPVELLEKANGRRFAAEIAANGFVGTPIGGLLFVAAMWLPFGFDAVTFAVAALLVSSIHIAATHGLRPLANIDHSVATSPMGCAGCRGTRCSADWQSLPACRCWGCR